MFKKGDWVISIEARRAVGSIQELKTGEIFQVAGRSSTIFTIIYLKGRSNGYDQSRFTKIDINSLTGIERALWGIE